MMPGFKTAPDLPSWERDELARETCPGCQRNLGVVHDLFADAAILACRYCHVARLAGDPGHWVPVDAAVVERLTARRAELLEQARLDAIYRSDDPRVWTHARIG